MPDGLFANPLHWMILLVIVLIVFGPGKLPSVGSALGKSVREFKKASREDDSSVQRVRAGQSGQGEASTASAAIDPAIRICPSCETPNPRDSRFCTDCGIALPQARIGQPIERTAEPLPPQEPPRPATPSAEAPPATASRIRCGPCGTENPAGNPFCVRCGRVLDRSSVAT